MVNYSLYEICPSRNTYTEENTFQNNLQLNSVYFNCHLNFKYITALRSSAESACCILSWNIFLSLSPHTFDRATLVYNDAIFQSLRWRHNRVRPYFCLLVKKWGAVDWFQCSSSSSFCQTELASSLPSRYPKPQTERKILKSCVLPVIADSSPTAILAISTLNGSTTPLGASVCNTVVFSNKNGNVRIMNHWGAFA